MVRRVFSLLFLIGSLNLYAGKYFEVKKSLEELRQGIASDPNECIVYYELGIYFLSKGKYDSAEVYFRKTLEIDDHQAEAYFGLYINELTKSEFLVCECLREVPSAHSKVKVKTVNGLAKSAFMMEPFLDWRPANIILRFYKEVHKYPLLQELIEDIWYFDLEGVEKFFLGEYVDAIKGLDEVLEEDSLAIHIHFLRGQAHARTKNFTLAAKDFEKVQDSLAYCNRHKFLPITLTPAILRFMIGHCYLNLKDFKKADEQFRKCVEDDPSFYISYLQLSRICLKKGNYTEAVKMLDKAIGIEPEDPVLHFNKGAILAKLGRVDDAIDEYQRAIKCNPHFCKAYFNLALVMEAIGKKAEAIDCYQKFIDHAPKRYQKFISQAQLKMDGLKR